MIFLKTRSQDPFERLSNSLLNFMKTHSLYVNVGNIDGIGRKGGDGVEGGFFNLNSKAVKKEQKYSRYTFLVLLGIFGLTGPLFMKIMSVIAAQALMASKAALIIVGSIALKKLFEKKEERPVVKVATMPLHDVEEEKHDRHGVVNGRDSYVQSTKENYNPTPYLGYYRKNDNKYSINNNEFAPNTYEKRYTIRKTR